jgi:hypothetical protein
MNIILLQLIRYTVNKIEFLVEEDDSYSPKSTLTLFNKNGKVFINLEHEYNLDSTS